MRSHWLVSAVLGHQFEIVIGALIGKTSRYGVILGRVHEQQRVEIIDRIKCVANPKIEAFGNKV